jgi:fused signal recognition particle receptor
MNFAGKIRDFFTAPHQVSDDFFDELGDLLVEGDFGAAPSMELVEKLQALSRKEKIGDTVELQKRFVKLLAENLLASDPDKTVEENSPAVILLMGVNGVGKTTTAAKLASRYRSRGRRPILAAADTFRAGAIDQLKIHGEKLAIRVVAHQQGGDPAAVVYDAAGAVLAGGGDLIIADTAGRMHTKTALVDELKKIDRVLETVLGKSRNTGGGTAIDMPALARHCIKWLVLDVTTGRNALAQAEVFHDAVALDGVILTKYDSSAKGGVVFSIGSELKIPVVFLCDGEGYDNIKPFDPFSFAGSFAAPAPGGFAG